MQPKHTPEPWCWTKVQHGYARVHVGEGGHQGNPIALVALGGPGAVHYDKPLLDANARRIVAAVNACADIPTEALEAGVVSELVEAAQAMLVAFMDGNVVRAPFSGNGDKALSALRAALSRARGESEGA